MISGRKNGPMHPGVIEESPMRNVLWICAAVASALTMVEGEHLKPLEPAVKAINAQFDVILSALPGIARKARVVAERRPT